MKQDEMIRRLVEELGKARSERDALELYIRKRRKAIMAILRKVRPKGREVE